MSKIFKSKNFIIMAGVAIIVIAGCVAGFWRYFNAPLIDEQFNEVKQNNFQGEEVITEKDAFPISNIQQKEKTIYLGDYIRNGKTLKICHSYSEGEVFTTGSGDCLNPLNKSILFTQSGWTEYINSHKKELFLRFDLKEHQKFACEFRYGDDEGLKKCHNLEEFIFPDGLSGGYKTVAILNDKLYFGSSGMSNGEWSEEFVIGEYDLKNNFFSVLGNELISGLPALSKFSTPKDDYVMVFSENTARGDTSFRGIIFNTADTKEALMILDREKAREIYQYQQDKNKKNPNKVLDKALKDQEFIDELILMMRRSMVDVFIIISLPSPREAGCGEWAEGDQQWIPDKDYIVKWNLDSLFPIESPIRASLFLRKINVKGPEVDYKDMPILADDIPMNIGENQYKLSIPSEYEGGRYMIVLRLHHLFYTPFVEEKHFPEFGSDIICVLKK